MKQFVLFFLISLQSIYVFAQQEKKAIYTGNQLYQQQKYPEAEQYYRQSVEKSQTSIEGNFNLGDAFYKQKKYDDAAKKFTDIASSSDDKHVKAQAYHNLGNTLLESKKLEESIAAYKKSLLNNPKDDETRYNLAYAQEMLKKQQQKKDNKDNDKNNKQNQDKQDKNNQQDQNKDKKDQDSQDKKNQDQQQKGDDNKQNKNQPNSDQDEQGEQKQEQPDKLSKEDAERMLEALNHEEKNTQDKLKNKKAKGVKGRITKDW
ncbi:hypothetical protein GCM10023231_15750 [Olivibacter ginsenosidimutans]|uniref:Tetratricopeptide repeat protein n=1 Tax=Olivibacter ginsenosidimutans TaxID=1176537 RepID=A0ABP9B389_9SPHI